MLADVLSWARMLVQSAWGMGGRTGAVPHPRVHGGPATARMPPHPNHAPPDLRVRRPQATFVLFESASGFALFELKGIDEIGQGIDKVQASVR